MFNIDNVLLTKEESSDRFDIKSHPLDYNVCFEDFKQDSTYDYLLVLDLTARRVVIVEDEVARSLYQEGADGAMIELKLGDYYQCDIGEVDVILPPLKLSTLIDEAIENYLDF